MEGNDFHFTALGVSDEFACEYVQNVLLPRIPNTNLTFRHRHTLQHDDDKVIPIFGYANKAERVDVEGKKYIRTEFTVPQNALNGHDLDDNIIYSKWIEKTIKEGTPAGISYHFQVYKDTETGKAYHANMLEIAGTPIPRCKTCMIGAPQAGEVVVNETERKELEKMDSKQLQALLEKITLEKEGLVQQLEDKKKALDDSTSKLKLEVDKSEKAITLVENLSKEFTSMKLELDYAKTKKPYVDEIVALEGVPEFEEVYRKKDIEWLKKRLEAIKGPKLQTSTLDPAAAMLRARKQLESDEPTEKDIVETLSKVNPKIAALYKNLVGGGGK